MRDEEAQRPQATTNGGGGSSSSTSSASGLSNSSSSKRELGSSCSRLERLFGRGKYKLWALAAIILLALWSMFTGTVTLKWSGLDLKHSSHDSDASIHADLDVLDVDEREKMVRQMWDVYKHSSIVRLPSFWREAFGAAYQDLTSEVANIRNNALLEIAKMSFRSRSPDIDIYELPAVVEPTAKGSKAEDQARPRTGKQR
ncbi:uncharacterized protein LOC127246511 [Andrographis paniculata]|uniref:uncharacterized protein LOC127246511 n=1 Tax=Andrographis paniculata TaxID=175694 RepID=UPI0021E8A42C|nr:uncharacterized protein LOC127246511 [Andrographis paniculata]